MRRSDAERFFLAGLLTRSSASNPSTTPQRKLRIYAMRSPLSVSLRIRFGIVGCDVLRNTSKDWTVVDGIAAMAENAGASCDVFWAPWHPRHVASTNRFPAAGSPTNWPKAMATLDRRRGALHADERTGMIGAPFGANVFTRHSPDTGHFRAETAALDGCWQPRTARTRALSAAPRRSERGLSWRQLDLGTLSHEPRL